MVSTGGATSIYTGGIAQCLGVVIAPAGHHGGLVAHVKQMGAKDGIEQQHYMTQWMLILLRFARDHWRCPQFDVALFRGDAGGTAWDLGLGVTKM